MDLSLPQGCSRDDAVTWYRRLLRNVGPGLHPDTPADEYTDPRGRRILDAHQCAALDASLGTLFDVLDDDAPYEIGADETHLMLAMRKYG